VTGNHLCGNHPALRLLIYIEYLFVLFSLVDCTSAALERDRHQLRWFFQVSSLQFVDGGSFGGNGLGLVFGVELHELGKIELGLLEDLGLVDKDVLEGEDFVALVSDLLGDGVTEDLLEEVLEGGFLGFVDHNLLHLLSDLLGLGGLGVASSLDLTVLSSGESNGEESDEVSVVGLGLDESLNERVPLLDEGAHLVSGDGDTGEVGEAIESLNFLNLELDDSPCEIVLVLLVKISLGDLENAASERVGGDVYKINYHGKRVFEINFIVIQGEYGRRVFRQKRSPFCEEENSFDAIYFLGSHREDAKQNLLCPWALLQGVKVGTLTSKRVGARMLYHSFLWKAWTLQNKVINIEV
jgi:hypothetical protein